MNRLFSLAVTLLMAFSSKAGAVGAGATGVLLTSASLSGQLPALPGLPEWVSPVLYGVAPAAAWLFVRIAGAFAAVGASISTNSRRRALALEALPRDQRPKNAEAIIYRLHERADKGEAMAAGLEALRSPPKTAP
jgi:hypothetical protein